MKKRWIASVLTVMMLIVFTACSTSGTSESAKDNVGGTVQEDTSSDASTEEKAPEDFTGTLTVWATDGDFITTLVPLFEEKYPNVTVNEEEIPNGDFLAKLTPTLANGQGAPDIFSGESDYVKYLVNSGYWDDLNSDSYQISEYIDDMWDYVVSVGTDDAGTLRAVSYQTSPGSILYRRDIAEKYLGSGEPEDVSEMLSSYDKMMEVAATLKENGVTMYASWQDILNMQFSNRENAWVVDDKLIIDDAMLDFMDMAKTIHENGYDLQVDPWNPEWQAAVENENVFCYVLPSWGYKAVVLPNANTTKGKWGIAEGAIPYVKGGTWIGIYKDSPNKELAWEFLKFCCLEAESQIQYCEKTGEYSSLKSVNESLAQGEGEECLAGQNQYATYNEIMEKLPVDLMSPYDGTINNAFLAATKAYATGVVDKDTALKQFKEDVTTAYPEISVK